MRFLKVENRAKYIPSFELFCLVGASSSRGHDDRIGQFGSGTKYSFALLAREGMLKHSKWCLGKDVYTFGEITHNTIDSNGVKDIHKEVTVKKQGGGTKDLNIDHQLGAVEWGSVSMAVREIVSNAIDGAYGFDGSTDTVIIETVDDEKNCRAKDGYIRVYIPLTEEVDDYIQQLENNFICLKRSYSSDKVILTKPNYDNAIVYRKGVKVGEYEPSLFNYNLNDIEISESRIIDSARAREKAAESLMRFGTSKQLETFFSEAVIKNNNLWESEFSHYDTNPRYMFGMTEERKSIIYGAIKNAVGDRVLCTDAISAVMVTSKGFQALSLGNAGYNEIFRNADIKTADKVLLPHEAEGKTVSKPTTEVIEAVDRVWDFLDSTNNVNGKAKPSVKCFNSALNGESKTNGYFRPGGDTIYIHEDISHDKGVAIYSVVLEEIGHYVTNARDCTRDFQDYFIRVLAAKILTDRNNPPPQ